MGLSEGPVSHTGGDTYLALAPGLFAPASQDPVHTRLLLQPLLLLCCFPLRWGLPGRVCTVEENEACLDPSPASDQDGSSHCQCVHQ